MPRNQRGSIRKELRAKGQTWVYRYSVSKPDGRRVEHTQPIGLVSKFPAEADCWTEIERLGLLHQVNKPSREGVVTFGQLAEHFIEHELGNQSESTDPRSHTTIENYKRNLRLRITPQWGKRPALSITPLEIEAWLRQLRQTHKLQNPTLDRHRRIMSLVFKSGQRYGLIPRGEEHNPLKFVRQRTTSDFEPMVLSPKQAFEIWQQLQGAEKALVLLVASTGLRVSEALGLTWADIDLEGQLIHIRRSWTGGKIGPPKSHASQASVPCHQLLRAHLELWHKETPYHRLQQWVFPSIRRRGKIPRSASVLVADHLRPAAIAAGILKEGEDCRYGLHTLRHSLATWLCSNGTDPHVVKSLLRHANVSTTLQLYAHAQNADRMTAQGQMLGAFFGNFSEKGDG